MTAPPRIAVTMGDPAGIGPELCLRLLESQPVVSIYGHLALMQRVARQLGWAAPPAERVRNFGNFDANAVVCGQVSAECGRASFQYVEAAIADALAKRIDAIVTAPINKEAWHAAGIEFPGHTELLAERCGATKHCMMLTSEAITCSLVTVHVGIAEVPQLLSAEEILNVIELTADAMRLIRGREPRLAVCGLNPHAGEGGLFGNLEEESAIVPAIADAKAKGYSVVGPLPPDTAFTPDRRAQTDAYICMYHDQGLIPLKALAFDDAVNVTLGLPIVRTSVDHGTAFDIAWKGVGNPTSLLRAVDLAGRLSEFQNEK